MHDVIRGEEWRQSDSDYSDEFAGLRPDQDVLAEARANIEQHRKGQLVLRLLDSAGTPRKGVRVRIRQLQHHFIFGNSMGMMQADVDLGGANAARAEHFVKLFNGTHAKCYWDEYWHQPIEKQQGKRILKRFLAELDWGCANGLAVRGHPLVWTVDKAIPTWLLRYSDEQQMHFLEHHVRSMIAAAEGRIRTWDLCNEMLWEPSLRNLPKRHWPHLEPIDEIVSYVEPALRWAREEDPSAVYCLNDYGLEVSFNKAKPVRAIQQRDRFVQLVKALREKGAAPDAIGTQAHIGKWFPMGIVSQTFAHLAQANVPMHVTEFWAHLTDHPNPEGKTPEQIEQDMTDYMANYTTVAFGTPQVTQMNFWEGGVFFQKNGWLKSPTYDAIYDLIRTKWWSDVETTSDDQGIVRSRVFFGKHAVTWASADGNPRSHELQLDPSLRGEFSISGA